MVATGPQPMVSFPSRPRLFHQRLSEQRRARRVVFDAPHPHRSAGLRGQRRFWRVGSPVRRSYSPGTWSPVLGRGARLAPGGGISPVVFDSYPQPHDRPGRGRRSSWVLRSCCTDDDVRERRVGVHGRACSRDRRWEQGHRIHSALAVIALAIALSARGRRIANSRFMVIGVALPSAFWFVRDWVGNSEILSFPEPVRIFGHQLFAGPTSPLTFYSTSMLQHLLRVDSGPLRAWSHSLEVFVGPVLVLAACGVIVGAVLGIRRRQWEMLALSLTAAAAWFIYAATPYTGGGPDGVTYLINAQERYALPALCLSARWRRLSCRGS